MPEKSRSRKASRAQADWTASSWSSPAFYPDIDLELQAGPDRVKTFGHKDGTPNPKRERDQPLVPPSTAPRTSAVVAVGTE